MSVSLQKAVVYLGEAGNVRGVPFNAAQDIRSPLRGWVAHWVFHVSAFNSIALPLGCVLGFAASR